MLLETHIQVADIPEEGLSLNFQDLSEVIPEIDKYVVVCQASGRIELHKSGHEIKIRGWVKSRVRLVCDRCLERFHSDLETDFFYLLQPLDEFRMNLKEKHQVTSEEIDVYWYDNGEIRAEELFREQILLQLPMRILCTEGCKGICPGCGADLNRERCTCRDAADEGPFSVLRQLKVARQGTT